VTPGPMNSSTHRLESRILAVAITLAAVPGAADDRETGPDLVPPIECESDYPRHLQGVCLGGEGRHI